MQSIAANSTIHQDNLIDGRPARSKAGATTEGKYWRN